MERCDEVKWWADTYEETLLNALEGDEDDAYEFKMAFCDLEAQCDLFLNVLQEWRYCEDAERDFDDCTVALIGNRYNCVGYDDVEEDYYSLTSYESGLAQTEAGKRVMRKTKAEMLSSIGQAVGILLAYWDLRQRFDYLNATFDILREENASVLRIVKEIDEIYNAAAKEDFLEWHESTKALDRLLAELPDEAWIV